MTISAEVRRANIKSAIEQMMEILGDRGYVGVRFERKKDFEGIYDTTWQELARLGWTEDCSTLTSPLHKLTGRGWIEGLKRTGKLDDPGFRSLLTDLKKHFKRSVKGRKTDAVLFLKTFGQEVGMDPLWIWSVIDSGILEIVFPKEIVDTGWWGGERGANIRAPITFGMEKL